MTQRTTKLSNLAALLFIGILSLLFVTYWMYGPIQESQHAHYQGQVLQVLATEPEGFRVKVKIQPNTSALNNLHEKYNDQEFQLFCRGYTALKEGDTILFHAIAYSNGEVARKCSPEEE